jgi:hypothetical protein
VRIQRVEAVNGSYEWRCVARELIGIVIT